MTYLSEVERSTLAKVLATFFSLPYSTDLDGKDAETLLRIAKGIRGRPSRRKELFDIVDGSVGYSVKTLRKAPSAVRVDLQEQRFCDAVDRDDPPIRQGEVLLSYMVGRIREQMRARNVSVAKSMILLKNWDKSRTHYSFRYWEEDFIGYVEGLWARHQAGSIEWVQQPFGLHARDPGRQDADGNNVRLLRMHYKHNQIFTDHDIPDDAVAIEFDVDRYSWMELGDILVGDRVDAAA